MSAADIILTGANVHTLDPARPHATAVAVKDGSVIAVGDERDVRDRRGPATELVDLAGATLTPGLTDAHSHPVWGLELTTGTDLTGIADFPSLLAALRSAPRVNGWVMGYSLDHNAFEGRPMHYGLIEEALRGAHGYLRLYDGHSALVSESVLRMAGIDGPRTFDQRAEVVCDAEGRPTGHLNEHAAMDLVSPVLMSAPAAERGTRLMELLSSMAATGLTSAHVMDLGRDAFELLAAVESETDLPIRLRFAPWCMPGATDDDLAELIALQRVRGRRWQVGGVKLFMDGTVEGGTAWLEHADCHGQGTDAFWPDPHAYSAAVRQLHEAGVPTATHAIGDAAVRHVLDTVESLGAGGPRHRIEHIETIPDDQIPRFARLGVVASMQPPHTAFTRADHTDDWSQRLGDVRASRAWRCRDLRDAGAVLALGSDWPIAHFDARQVLAMARTPKGAAVRGTGLTGLMALEGMTSQAAFAAGEDHVTGQIAVGYRADLTAFGLDPIAAPADEVAEAPVALTMTAGRIVFRG
ncbi:amidohydrolase [Streptomyces albipurpureus]|uniref:Amidohydrolase n=1 Tax=Streptomyces albipurpureus TaxID=2897419 RepID=A0ABT0UQZ3_9ACTN|nr:amidohydrolase [Streptomyces sp. CWNU-1]MCM2391032.1 amidohydrolase [Streptomyces sp. CWNU-1]